jgi:two-component system cell cycle sensor histidine kinase/response regulator CckA
MNQQGYRSTILIVEDEKITAMDIRERLQGLGYDVPADVSTGEEAIEKTEQLKPDLVLMDVILRGAMDGVEAAEIIKNRFRIPIVFLTAFSDDQTLQRAKIAGPFGYVLKPFDERELHSTIEMALYRHSVEEAIRRSEEKFSLVFKASPDMAAITRIENGEILDINDAFVEMTGYTREEALGHSTIDLLWVDPQRRADLVRLLSLEGKARNLETVMRMKSGERKTFLLSSEIIEVEGQKCLLTFNRDITDRKRIEAELEDSEHRLREAQAIAHLGYMDWDLVTNDLVWSEETFRIFGFDPVSYTPTFESMIQMVHPEDGARVEQHLQAALRGEELYDIEHRMIRPDGRIITVEAKARLRSSQDGKPSHLIGTIIDVTERRKAEEALRASEEKFSKVFKTNPDAINVTRLSDGLYLDVNSSFLELTGYSRDEVVGRTAPEIGIWEDAEVRSRALAQIQQQGELKNFEARFKMKDGSIITGLISCVSFELGGEKCLLSITRDISDLKKAESDLRRSEERYREFFERDLTGNFIATPEGKITDCNPAFARILGFGSVAEAMEKDVAGQFIGATTWKTIVDAIRQHKQLEYHEAELKTAVGSSAHVVENISGEFDQFGNLVQLRGYMFDDTERKALEQQLFQVQKMESVGTLASGIAHDFNNVLNNILGFMHQLKKNVDDQAKVIRYAETIEKSALRGADLANQLLLFVRRKKRENTVVNIEEVIDEVLQLAHETFPKTIALRKSIAPLQMHVFGDRSELYQVILNMCLNSRDAITQRRDQLPQGSITIQAVGRKIGEDSLPKHLFPSENMPKYCVELSVTDNGIGIPLEIRDKIFDPFFTTKERGKGTGLGLSVVYNIVKNHSGSVTVDSNESRGTTLRIFLPAVDDESPTSPPIEPVATATTRHELILLVDDEEMMQELGKELLEDAGYRVSIARNGEEAIRIYRDHWNEIALVMLDLVMPGMDGGQVYVQLKKINPKLRAFFCTGYTQDKIITSLLEQENLRALEKPFKPPQLLKTVHEVITSP